MHDETQQEQLPHRPMCLGFPISGHICVDVIYLNFRKHLITLLITKANIIWHSQQSPKIFFQTEGRMDISLVPPQSSAVCLKDLYMC